MDNQPDTPLRAAWFRDENDNQDWVIVNGHQIGVSGGFGDYCITHRSFQCSSELTGDEMRAINNATAGSK